MAVSCLATMFTTRSPVSQSARDVCDAVEYFKTHGRISQTVMEASIFRQPYFVGQFLPALLMPAVGLHERQELIEALDRLVRIACDRWREV